MLDSLRDGGSGALRAHCDDSQYPVRPGGPGGPGTPGMPGAPEGPLKPSRPSLPYAGCPGSPNKLQRHIQVSDRAKDTVFPSLFLHQVISNVNTF